MMSQKKLRKIQHEFQAELDMVRAGKAAAEKRMNEQRASGQMISCERSRQAYVYASKYEKHLEAILDGYNRMKDSTHWLTKNAERRYVPARREA